MSDDPPESATTPPRGPLTFSVRNLMFFIACCAIGFTLLGLLMKQVNNAQEAARSVQCLCNLCTVKLALQNYHSQYGSFPPAYVADARGRRMHSWRILILPFMEEQGLYNLYRLDEPWDGPNNRRLLGMMPRFYACPNHRDPSSGLTSYVAITGPGTAFPGAGTTKIADITDGTHDTIFLAEVCTLDIPWTAPRDLDTASMSFRINDPARPSVSAKDRGGPAVIAVDGTYWRLKSSTDQQTLRAMTTIAGGEPIYDATIGR